MLLTVAVALESVVVKEAVGMLIHRGATELRSRIDKPRSVRTRSSVLRPLYSRLLLLAKCSKSQKNRAVDTARTAPPLPSLSEYVLGTSGSAGSDAANPEI